MPPAAEWRIKLPVKAPTSFAAESPVQNASIIPGEGRGIFSVFSSFSFLLCKKSYLLPVWVLQIYIIMSCFKLPSWVRRVYNEFFFFSHRCRGAAFHPAKKKRKAQLRCYHFHLLASLSLIHWIFILSSWAPMVHYIAYFNMSSRSKRFWKEIEALDNHNQNMNIAELGKDSPVNWKNIFNLHNS